MCSQFSLLDTNEGKWVQMNRQHANSVTNFNLWTSNTCLLPCPDPRITPLSPALDHNTQICANTEAQTSLCLCFSNSYLLPTPWAAYYHGSKLAWFSASFHVFHWFGVSPIFILWLYYFQPDTEPLTLSKTQILTC